MCWECYYVCDPFGITFDHAFILFLFIPIWTLDSVVPSPYNIISQKTQCQKRIGCSPTVSPLDVDYYQLHTARYNGGAAILITCKSHLWSTKRGLIVFLWTILDQNLVKTWVSLCFFFFSSFSFVPWVFKNVLPFSNWGSKDRDIHRQYCCTHCKIWLCK